MVEVVSTAATNIYTMQLLFALVVLLGSASAFILPAARISTTQLSMNDERSIALPFDKRPPNLDGTLPGDVGFDPAGFSNNPPKKWLIGGEENSLKWYREAEIVHGRVAQLAVLGMLVPSWYHFPGNPELGVAENAFAELNPYKALTTVPPEGLWQIALVIFGIELARVKRIIRGDKNPGDLGLGQTGFNPFGFQYTEEQYFEKQVQEIKHGRLAMFGALGMLLQTSASGKTIPQQLAEAFTFPDDRALLDGPGTLGDFFPPGI
jgi:light-harvesting complex I chlorophyll a/b binding protein 1